MTLEEFQTQIARLSANWPNFYTTTRVNILWDAFMKLELKVFQHAVTEALGTMRSAPLRDELQEVVTKAAGRGLSVARGGAPQTMGVSWAPCAYCGAEGAIMLEHASGQRGPGACDHCESGRDRKSAGMPGVYALMDRGFKIETTPTGRPLRLRNGDLRADYPVRQRSERTWGTRSQEGGTDE